MVYELFTKTKMLVNSGESFFFCLMISPRAVSRLFVTFFRDLSALLLIDLGLFPIGLVIRAFRIWTFFRLSYWLSCALPIYWLS